MRSRFFAAEPPVCTVELSLRNDLADRLVRAADNRGMEPADLLADLIERSVSGLRIAAERREVRPRKKAKKEPARIIVPAWVPEGMARHYELIAERSGEERAAAWARRQKRRAP